MSKGKIIDANGAPAGQDDEAKAKEQPKAKGPKHASQELVAQMAGAMHRFNELNAQTVDTPNRSSEMKGIMDFLANSFLAHREEFIGCWLAMHNEYDPLIKGFAALIGRASARNNQIMQQAEKQAAKQAEPPADEEGK